MNLEEALELLLSLPEKDYNKYYEAELKIIKERKERVKFDLTKLKTVRNKKPETL